MNKYTPLLNTYISLSKRTHFSMRKDDMKRYTAIIQTGLQTSSSNVVYLPEKVKGDLDVIIKNIDKSWAPLKATIASIVAKIHHPDWDTRKHQTQIGGKYSLRTIDKCYISDYMFKNGFYDTPTEFALTRSFEKAESYTLMYSGNISPKESKNAFLNLVDVINTEPCEKLLNDMLVYLLVFLKERKTKNTIIKESTVDTINELTLNDVLDVLDKLFSLGSGISVVPVIVVHTLLSVIRPYVFPGIYIKNLKEHTAPDNHTVSYGDVEGFNENYIPVIAIEIKHMIKINESILLTFDKKTSDMNIPLKFILTTAKTHKECVKNNICIDTVSGFTTSYLQYAILHEPNICSMFLKELRTNIVSYHNISFESKDTINKIITTILV